AVTPSGFTLVGMERLDPQIGATAAQQYGLVTRAQALAIGMSPKAIKRRLAAARWEMVWSDVYRLAGSPQTWRQQLLTAVLAAGDRAAASGESAAALWQLPGFSAGPIEVTSPVGKSRRPIATGGRQSCLLPGHHMTKVDGIRVTTVPRTIFDLMAIVS